MIQPLANAFSRHLWPSHGNPTHTLSYPQLTYYRTVQGLLEGNRSFTGSSGSRRTIAWYPSDMPADQVNVTLTITNTSELHLLHSSSSSSSSMAL